MVKKVKKVEDVLDDSIISDEDPFDFISDLDEDDSSSDVMLSEDVKDVKEADTDGSVGSEVGLGLDIESSSALLADSEDIIEVEEAVLDGDPNDPFDERSFKICTNEGCPYKAGCLRWRLRKQRAEFGTQSFFFADQDDCLVRADNYMNDFALDPVEDWAY